MAPAVEQVASWGFLWSFMSPKTRLNSVGISVGIPPQLASHRRPKGRPLPTGLLVTEQGIKEDRASQNPPQSHRLVFSFPPHPSWLRE